MFALDLKQDCVGIRAYIKKRMQQNSDLDAIIGAKQGNVSPAVYAELQCFQPTSTAVERSFSISHHFVSVIPK